MTVVLESKGASGMDNLNSIDDRLAGGEVLPVFLDD
jgi:hypothetical protein